MLLQKPSGLLGDACLGCNDEMPNGRDRSWFVEEDEAAKMLAIYSTTCLYVCRQFSKETKYCLKNPTDMGSLVEVIDVQQKIMK